MIFGNSRGQFEFPDREIVNSNEWCSITELLNMDYHMDDFDNETFTIRPYYWGEDEELMELPNFIYKPTGFEIQWYKYPFRDSYMNQDLSKKEIINIFKKCVNSINH